MPGRVFLSQDGAALGRHFSKSPAKIPTGVDLAPAQMLGIILPDRITVGRWGMIPTGAVNARGRPVLEPLVNIRSETLTSKKAYESVRDNRCILPCSGWYEWTGETRRKTRWSIHAPGQPILSFAAIYDIWTAPDGQSVISFATLTCAPNADVNAYHHRMPVILSDPAAWLEGKDVALQPAPVGTLVVAPSDLA